MRDHRLGSPPARAGARVARAERDGRAPRRQERARLTQAPVPAEQQGADEPPDVRHAVK